MSEENFTLKTEKDKKLAYLENRISGKIKKLSDSKKKYDGYYGNASVVIAVLAALNTFFVAITQFGDHPYKFFAIFALISGELITVVSAWEALTKPKDKFIQNAEALNEIIDTMENLNYIDLRKEPITETELDEVFTRLRKLEKEFFSNLTKITIRGTDEGTTT